MYSILIIFCRIGTFCIFLPPVGEMNISQRIRLLFGVMFSYVVALTIFNNIPLYPKSTLQFFLLIFQEIFIGISFGVIVRALLSAMHVLGMTFSLQSGLSMGMIFDPSQGSQGSIFGSLLSMTFLVLFMIADGHLKLIEVINQSYDAFPIGSFFSNSGSFIEAGLRACSDAFNIGVQLAAPYIVVGIAINIAFGVLSRIMPQMQVFFIMLPAQILAHLFVFFIAIGSGMLWFLGYYQEHLTDMLSFSNKAGM
ncbi:MAG: flagellar biosynthetic protein FliR [Candidatus Jidaibacter sp.]|nr:flagellar biosynthetic protein FliR [Candidatus Jidaibacter sp.]